MPLTQRTRRLWLLGAAVRSEEHTSELQSQSNLVCRLLLEKKKKPPRGCRLPQERPDNRSVHPGPAPGPPDAVGTVGERVQQRAPLRGSIAAPRHSTHLAWLPP